MLKAVTHKFYKRGDGQEGTPWQYTVGYSVEESLSEGYFNSIVHNVLIGDDIRIVRQEKDDQGKLHITERLDVIVTFREISPPLVLVARLSDVAKFPLPKAGADEDVSIPDEVHVPEDCTAKWKGPVRMFEIVGTSGTVYATGIEDKDEAHSIARGDLPVPEKGAA